MCQYEFFQGNVYYYMYMSGWVSVRFTVCYQQCKSPIRWDRCDPWTLIGFAWLGQSRSLKNRSSVILTVDTAWYWRRPLYDWYDCVFSLLMYKRSMTVQVWKKLYCVFSTKSNGYHKCMLIICLTSTALMSSWRQVTQHETSSDYLGVYDPFRCCCIRWSPPQWKGHYAVQESLC